MRRFAAAAVLLALAACAMPATVVRTGVERPTLAFEGAPDGAVLYLDGERVGEANRYDGQPQVLIVEPGTHLVTVKARDGATVFEQRLYVEGALKTIQVSGP